MGGNVRNYRELRVWQEAHAMTLQIYRVTTSFPADELYGLRSQLRRAASSIGANLAEGCDRLSSADFGRFVRMAMGSASDLDYHLLLATDLGYVERKSASRIEQQLMSVRKMLTVLDQKLHGTAEQAKAAAAGGSAARV
jgi:four helix bundle protein